MPTLPLDPSQGDPVDVQVGDPQITDRQPAQIDVQALPLRIQKTPERVDTEAHLTHLLDIARLSQPQEQTPQDTTPQPEKEIPSSVGDKVTEALKYWREGVHHVGALAKDAALGMAGFNSDDPRTGTTLDVNSPEAKALGGAAEFIGQGAADAPLLALAPEAGVTDLAGEYISKGLAEHLAPEAPKLASVLGKAARIVSHAAAGVGEGAAYSAADTALSGGSAQEIKDAATSPMNLLGAVAGVRGMHSLVGVATHEGLNHLASETDTLIASGKAEEVPRAEIKPSFAQFTDKDGAPVFRITEHDIGGTPKYTEIPLDNAHGIEEAKQYIKARPKLSLATTPEGFLHLAVMDAKDMHELVTAGSPVDEQGDLKYGRPSPEPAVYGQRKELTQPILNVPSDTNASPLIRGGTKVDRPVADTNLRREPNPSGNTRIDRPLGEPPTQINGRDNQTTGVLPAPDVYTRRDMLGKANDLPEDRQRGGSEEGTQLHHTQGHALTVDHETGHLTAEPIPVEATTQAQGGIDYAKRGQPSIFGGSGNDGKPTILPPEEEGKFRDLVDTARMIQHPESSWKNTAFEGLQHDMHRGAPAAQQLKQKMYSARNLGNEAELANAFKQQLPERKFLSSADKSLEQVGLGKMSLEQFRNQHPEVGQSLIEIVKPAIDEITANEKELEARGVLAPGTSEARARGDMDKYLAASYMAHVLPKGKWVPPTEALENALAKLEKEHPGAPPEILQKHLDRLINNDDSTSSMIHPGAVSDRLKVKDINLSQTTKDVLGEIHSGAIRMAFTIAQQKTLLGKLRAWDEVAMSKFYSPTPKPGWAHVENSKMFGKVADGYLDPEVAGLLKTNPIEKPSSDLEVWKVLGQQVKANWTYRNLNAQVNNAARNVKASIMVDGLRLHEPVQSAKHFLSALQALSNWKKSPFVTDELSHFVDRARNNEALPAGMGRMEVLAPDHVFDDLLKQLQPVITDAKGKATITSLISKLQQNPAINGLRKFDQSLKHIYDGTDQVFKLANFMAVTERLQKRGLSMAEADAIAGRRINESFPNYEHVGNIVDKARKAPFGALAPMLSGAAEDIRNNIAYSKVLVRAATDPLERERVVSMLKQVGIIGAAAAAGQELRRLNGTSDAEVEAAKEVRSQSGQYYHPATAALPWKDAKGRIQLFDPSSWLPDLQYAQGNPDDALWRRIAANLITQPFQSSMSEATAKSAIARTGLVRPQYTGQPPMEGENSPRKAIQDYMLQTMLPGTITHGYEALRKAGVVGTLGRNESQLTPPQAAAKMIIPGITPVSLKENSKALSGSKAEEYGQFKDLEDQKRRLVRRTTKGGDLEKDPQTAKQIRAAIDVREQQIKDRMIRINSLMEKAGVR